MVTERTTQDVSNTITSQILDQIIHSLGKNKEYMTQAVIPSRMKFNERLKYYANRKKKNVKSIAMEVMAEEREECTFIPRVNSCERKNLKQFLNDQETSIEVKQRKLKNYQKSQVVNMRNSSKRAKSNNYNNKSTVIPNRSRNINTFLSKQTNTKIKQSDLYNSKRVENKQSNILKLRMNSELDAIFNKINPNKASLDFSQFCKL